MSSWEIHHMWLIITHDDIGVLSKHPVSVFDDEKDANDHIKQLENTSGDFFGNHGITMWRKVPIKVHLNEKNFTKKEKKND